MNGLRGAAPISSVLIANRGEIAVRICRTLAQLGIHSIAVHSLGDADALHVRVADECLAVDSYLDADALVAAALRAGADAVHPGYGFLSEDPRFARAVVDAGVIWIGPPPEAIEAMGDKIRARKTVAAAGVPVVAGAGRPGLRDDELVAAALDLGLPVLIKPAAGGGGKGMRRVDRAEDLAPSIEAARREARSAFGDGTLLVERFIPRPRHVEVQVFADASGNVVHLGERECSLQRRHQKIVEESPSPLIDDATRTAMTTSALEVARACGYVGAGTVEFIVSGDRPDEYFFMEMNTRLQVEHPVTEAVTGIDLVEWQVRVAAGEPLPAAQRDIVARGHAVEARVYAEDPVRGFLPASGTVVVVGEPAGRRGVRVDSSLVAGLEVGTHYDPMLAKVIAWAETRAAALSRLRAALAETVILGVTTNVGYLTRLLALDDVVAGRLDTELVDRTLGELASPGALQTSGAAAVAACRVALDLEPASAVVDPWDVPDAWRVGGPGEWTLQLRLDGRPVGVVIRGRVLDGATLRVDGGPPASVRARALGDGGALEVTVDGVATRWRTARLGGDVWVGHAGCAWRFAPDPTARGDGAVPTPSTGPVTSPMPGVVVALHVARGDIVRAGQPLVAVEAMKMEHAVVAPVDGVVSELWVRRGQTVALDEPLMQLAEPSPSVSETEER